MGGAGDHHSLVDRHPLLYRHRPESPSPRHPHPCKFVLLAAGPTAEPGTRSELLGRGEARSWLPCSHLPTEESDCVPAGSVGDTVMSLSWGPQLIQQTGLPKPLPSASLDSSSQSISFLVSAPRERDQNQSHGGVSERLRRSGALRGGWRSRKGSISPCSIRGFNRGVDSTLHSSINSRHRAFSASLAFFSV